MSPGDSRTLAPKALNFPSSLLVLDSHHQNNDIFLVGPDTDDPNDWDRRDWFMRLSPTPAS